jgi:hypothetical protein
MKDPINEFLSKFHEDKKFQSKAKLLGYGIFFAVVVLYIVLSGDINSNQEYNYGNDNITNEETTDVLKLPETYSYTINVEIDENKYEYSGKKTPEREYIRKIVNNTITNYKYEDGKYYVEDSMKIDTYNETTRDEIYDVVNYSYVNFATINEYLKKAQKDGNYYQVYLKDIIVGNDSENYFTITIDNNNIDIDYTVLAQEYDKNNKLYKVSIEITEDN